MQAIHLPQGTLHDTPLKPDVLCRGFRIFLAFSALVASLGLVVAEWLPRFLCGLLPREPKLSEIEPFTFRPLDESEDDRA